MNKKVFIFFLSSLPVLLSIHLLPLRLTIPVKGADTQSWDPRTFWYYPWGVSEVHKGIDIYADRNTEVIAPVDGIVLSVSRTTNGGNIIYLLGPKWQVHYFAHMERTSVTKFKYVRRGATIGYVGNTGNASNKPPHLHYSISTIIPQLWEYDEYAYYGWEKIFYVNPGEYFE
jgi:peptidoglycan LD-endopeptidase LytH